MLIKAMGPVGMVLVRVLEEQMKFKVYFNAVGPDNGCFANLDTDLSLLTD
jgi:hypothetical protein